MTGYLEQINCRTCNRATDLKHAGYYDDRSQRLLCSCCEKDGGVLHSCIHDYPLSSPTWLPLVMAGVGVVCPQCKKIYDVGVAVEPTYPQAGAALQAIGFVAEAIVVIGIVNDLLQARNKRKR